PPAPHATHAVSTHPGGPAEAGRRQQTEANGPLDADEWLHGRSPRGAARGGDFAAWSARHVARWQTGANGQRACEGTSLPPRRTKPAVSKRGKRPAATADSPATATAAAAVGAVGAGSAQASSTLSRDHQRQ